MAIPAGMMSHRVRFERRTSATDGYGNTLSSWETLYTLWARFKATPGREALEAGRLESTMTGMLTVRRSTDTITITAADRGVFTAGPHKNRIFNIRSIVAGDDNSSLDMTIEEGVAT